ncbi:hypothetical protein Phi40:1_gp052 [Cellulophaga phage phi40:1]|uniref:Uncharacterized protein n=1 Tax=Cellulophaga phage phi38:1 TaxID=1327977 RepID=S0A0S3_9CAUD|nr:hypothetical protein Phi38:1_gp052 [Cellulophaga phage phi38:1]AGO47917.1 hypothetical protein Phi40:1_gp052 [Cellulophaga phage phi40:1]AGO48082.1 hypothetical protein Phi38:1_gp052 [Cellulophaga phage phi38:1]
MRRVKRLSLILVLTLVFVTIVASAQESTEPTYVVQGDKIVKVGGGKSASEATKTKYTMDVKGVEYPVYKSTRGSYYILRTSKKSGKEYKQYIKITGL